MVYLSIEPQLLDLSLTSVRRHLRFIERIVVLTQKPISSVIAKVAARHFADVTILTDDEVSEGALPDNHTARNTWLRRNLYRHHCIEPNFLASDADYLALRSLEPSFYLTSGIHTGYYFREDMSTWLAGSPRVNPFDDGIRNAWHLLRRMDCPARAYSSHMPQLINKRLCNCIFARFEINARGPPYDEWSLYFNAAEKLYPAHFAHRPYATLGWPMRTGDWYPEITPEEPAFENYYPENYSAADNGMFVGLDPLGDLEPKLSRTLEAIERAKRVEVTGDGLHRPGVLALLLGDQAMAFVASGSIVSGGRNVRRVLLLNCTDGTNMTGQIEMFITDKRGRMVRGECIRLGEACWIPFLPPEEPGSYTANFFATLRDGTFLQTSGQLTLTDAAIHAVPFQA